MTDLSPGDIVIHEDGRTGHVHRQAHGSKYVEWQVAYGLLQVETICWLERGNPVSVEALPEGWRRVDVHELVLRTEVQTEVLRGCGTFIDRLREWGLDADAGREVAEAYIRDLERERNELRSIVNDLAAQQPWQLIDDLRAGGGKWRYCWRCDLCGADSEIVTTQRAPLREFRAHDHEHAESCVWRRARKATT